MRSLRTVAIPLILIVLAAFAAFAPVRSNAQAGRSPFDRLHFRDIGPAATGGRIHDIPIDPKNPAVLYVAAATGGIWKSTNKGVTWKDIFGSSRTTRSARSRSSQATRRSSGPARASRTTARARRGAAASIAPPTPARRGRTSACTTRARSDASCSIPTDPNVAYVAAVGNLWTGNAGARRLQDDRRRPHVDQGALRRHVHRRDRPRDGPARLRTCSTRRRISGCARRSASTAAAPAARSTRRTDARRDVEEARERHSRRRQGTHRPRASRSRSPTS